MTYEAFWKSLTPIYDPDEAKAITRLVAEVLCGLSWADLIAGKDMTAVGNDLTAVDAVHRRLLSGEPVQYVLGEAVFYGRSFSVGPGVLIPRPETEELCRWITCGDYPTPPRILDIGTGSGCIAVTLSKEMPTATVNGWDISDTALETARKNAVRHKATVVLNRRDILATPWDDSYGLWDIIVSNPPYVCRSEGAAMKPWVVDHEPATALFVPDDDPLLFYRHIGHYAWATLRDGGVVYFEINPLYARQITALLSSIGFSDTETHNDQFGKTRFIRAWKRNKT